MKKNVEFKAYYEDIEKAKNICLKLGASKKRDHKQIDKYYHAINGRLKLRDDREFGKHLIYYERLNNSKARSCLYDKIDVSSHGDQIAKLLDKALGIASIVEKQRVTFETEHALINLDDLDFGKFIEIEVLTENTKSIEHANVIAEELRILFDISPMDIVPFSYADLQIMRKVSLSWREIMSKTKKVGRLFLLDGCSCSGKTTLSQKLLKENDVDLTFIPRHCTRNKRADEISEYIFISNTVFNKLASKGTFIEYRDFEFGMSYGLAWEETMQPLLKGHNALGIMNLGNVLHVKKFFPEAITILIKTQIETIRNRLQDRGCNNDEQIRERLESAKTVYGQERHYDYVINNDNGMLENAIKEMKDIITKTTA